MEEKGKNKALLSDQNAKVSESKAKTKIPDTSKIYLDQVALHAYYIITHIIHICIFCLIKNHTYAVNKVCQNPRVKIFHQ